MRPASPARRTNLRARIRKWVLKSAFYLLVSTIIFYSAFPFYYAIVTSFKTGTNLFRVSYFFTEFSLDNYTYLFVSNNFFVNMANSVIVATVVVVISLFLAVTASYAFARIDFRGRKTMLLSILGVSMFPQIAVLAGLYETLGYFDLFNTLFSVIFAYMIFTLPFTVWVLTTFMRELPKEIEEAATIDGATPWITVTRVFLPLMWPAMVTTGLLAFIAAWNEFLFALTFLSNNDLRTVPVAIALLSGASQYEIPWGNIMAASVLVTLPLLLLVLVFQHKIVAGLTAGSVKG